jgi:hypothetical protein
MRVIISDLLMWVCNQCGHLWPTKNEEFHPFTVRNVGIAVGTGSVE